MLFSAAIVEFIRHCRVERQLSEHTIQAYGCDLADLGKRLPREALVEDVTIETLKSYLEGLVSHRRRAPATVRRRLACFRGFFRHFCRGVAGDPFAGWAVKLPRHKRLPRALSRAEMSTLLSALGGRQVAGQTDGAELRLAVRLMISTGLRVGELCKLRAKDVSPDGRSVRINGKGSRDRIAYITEMSLQRELSDLVSKRQKQTGETGHLFLNRHGLKMKPQSIRAKLHKTAQLAGLGRRITPHMLRHTAATLLIETGVDIRIVQRLLGHSSIATTEIYTHVSDEALRVSLERANVLGSFIPR
jgi:site-specific recombinase XerD